MKRKDLLSLPRREWRIDSSYTSILITPTGRKHDSGFALMAIVGCDDDGSLMEIAAMCDDIQWVFPPSNGLMLQGLETQYYYADIQSDMYFPSGIIRMHTRHGRFIVGISLSSTQVTFIRNEDI